MKSAAALGFKARAVAVVVVALCAASGSAKVVHPRDQAEPHCGARSLYVALLELGKGPNTYRELVRHLGEPTAQGYSMDQLRNAADAFGAHAICVQMPIHELQLVPSDTSVIALLDEGHYALLGGFSREQFTLYDAATGRVACLPYAYLAEWSGYTILLSDTEIQYPLVRSNPLMIGFVSAGIAATCFGILWSLYWKRYRSFRFMLFLCFVALNGCSKPDGADLRSKIALESSNLMMGDLPFSTDRQLVVVSLKNAGSAPLKIVRGELSCPCLSASPRFKSIEPQGKGELELYLDCSVVGPRGATYTFSTSDDQSAAISVGWNVAHGIEIEPKACDTVDIASNQEVTILLKLSGDTSSPINVDHEFTSSTRLDPLKLSITTDLVGEICEVRIKALDCSEAATFAGNIVFRNGSLAVARVPFVVRVNTELDFHPRRLDFYEQSGIYRSQLVIESARPSAKLDMVLLWNSDVRLPCDAIIAERGEVSIVEVSIRKEVLTSDMEHIAIIAGDVERIVPVTFVH